MRRLASEIDERNESTFHLPRCMGGARGSMKEVAVSGAKSEGPEGGESDLTSPMGFVGSAARRVAVFEVISSLI